MGKVECQAQEVSSTTNHVCPMSTLEVPRDFDGRSKRGDDYSKGDHYSRHTRQKGRPQ